jgi:hypothetical protein
MRRRKAAYGVTVLRNTTKVGNRTYALTEVEIAVVDGADCTPRTDWRTDQTAL